MPRIRDKDTHHQQKTLKGILYHDTIIERIMIGKIRFKFIQMLRS